MKFTKLGKTGINVSKICLGTMTFGYTVDEKESNGLIQRALELGINFFDTANVYARGRSEEILGAAIKKRRAEVVIASKVFWSFSQPQASRVIAIICAERIRRLSATTSNRLRRYLLRSPV